MNTPASALSPAASAFDAVAPVFDRRFGAWLSVAAQREQVRSALMAAFPPGARLLELGGGTGDDAVWMALRGREVLLTDASPAMVHEAAEKLRWHLVPPPRVLDVLSLGTLADEREAQGLPPFDGVYSNFAALNCVDDLAALGPALARLVRPGGRAVLVIFGTCAPGELVVQLLRGAPRAAIRRLASGPVPARLGGREFTVRYHRRRDVRRAFAPWFRLEGRRGVGVFVPPSAAEPWISRFPLLVRALALLDRVASRPLAMFGDHVLYVLRREPVAAP